MIFVLFYQNVISLTIQRNHWGTRKALHKQQRRQQTTWLIIIPHHDLKDSQANYIEGKSQPSPQNNDLKCIHGPSSQEEVDALWFEMWTRTAVQRTGL